MKPIHIIKNKRPTDSVFEKQTLSTCAATSHQGVIQCHYCSWLVNSQQVNHYSKRIYYIPLIQDFFVYTVLNNNSLSTELVSSLADVMHRLDHNCFTAGGTFWRLCSHWKSLEIFLKTRRGCTKDESKKKGFSKILFKAGTSRQTQTESVMRSHHAGVPPSYHDDFWTSRCIMTSRSMCRTQ